MKFHNIRCLIIILLVFISYGNTLTLDYALDDRLVIFENDYTLQGFSGIKKVMTKDSFSGYFGEEKNLVAGGRYRPLAQLTFILEYEVFGGKIKDQAGLHRDPANEALFCSTSLPFVGHLVNIVLYILLSLLVFQVLKKIFPRYDHEKWYLSLPFTATLLFALHPLHTEVVANIKGRDEILSMLGAFASLWCTLQFIDKRKIYQLGFSFLALTAALFAKENAITFLAITPLVLYFTPLEKKKGDYLFTLLPLILAGILFLTARQQAIGVLLPEDTTRNILNNPFITSTVTEKIATVILTWGIYLKLLCFPHPLTHDYYPKQIAITDFSNPMVWLLLLFFSLVVLYAVKTFQKKNTLSFAILYFVITFSITANLFFSIGTLMNERFVFIPSLGFAILIGYFLMTLSKMKIPKNIVPALLILILALYSVKTFSRNFIWKNDITLFTTDVKVSENSIKCNISAGGSYLKLYQKNHKESDLKKARQYLTKALQLDSTAFNAHLLLGEFYFFKEDYHAAYQCYYHASLLDPANPISFENMALTQQMQTNSELSAIEKKVASSRFEEALGAINQYLDTHPNSAEAYNIKGKILGKGMGQLEMSIENLLKAIELKPDYASALENLGVAYAIKGDYQKALTHLLKAHEISPTDPNIKNNIANLYRDMGQPEKATPYQR